MSHFFSLLEKLLLPVAVIALAVSLGDLSGLFHLLPTPQMSFLLLLMTLLTLSTAGFVQHRCARLGRDLAPAAGGACLRHVDDVVAHIDPNLRKVWGDNYFARMDNLLQTAVQERRVEIDDFALYFKRLLQAYPQSTFLSTSALSASHLWTNKEIAQALAGFIQAGGRIRQIFFVQSLEEEASVEMRIVLDQLRKIGVCVQVVSCARLSCNMRTFFVAESHGSIAWEIPFGPQGRIGTSAVTADKRAIARYIELFTYLWDNPC